MLREKGIKTPGGDQVVDVLAFLPLRLLQNSSRIFSPKNMRFINIVSACTSLVLLTSVATAQSTVGPDTPGASTSHLSCLPLLPPTLESILIVFRLQLLLVPVVPQESNALIVPAAPQMEVQRPMS